MKPRLLLTILYLAPLIGALAVEPLGPRGGVSTTPKHTTAAKKTTTKCTTTVKRSTTKPNTTTKKSTTKCTKSTEKSTTKRVTTKMTTRDNTPATTPVTNPATTPVTTPATTPLTTATTTPAAPVCITDGNACDTTADLCCNKCVATQGTLGTCQTQSNCIPPGSFCTGADTDVCCGGYSCQYSDESIELKCLPS